MKLFIKQEQRAIALLSNGYVLVFESPEVGSKQPYTPKGKNSQPTIVVKSMPENALKENGFREVTTGLFSGLLGLISLKGYVFIGLIAGVQKVGYPRWKMDNGSKQIIGTENIYQILNVDFYCLNSDAFDFMLFEISEQNYDRLLNEHPCGPLKKLFCDGSFYYSRDFDISNILQERGLINRVEYTVDNLDQKFIWNLNLISEIVQLRNRITAEEKPLFDGGKFLTFTMRGFCKTIVANESESPTALTIISRISTENKENIFGLQGIDGEGRVANFIETEIIVTTSRYIFAYTQTRGNVPLSWEVVEGQLLHGKKIKLNRSPEFTQAAFDKHFDDLASKYGVVSVVNLVKPKSASQEVLSSAYKTCADNKNIKITNVEYTSDLLTKSSHKLLYILKQDIFEFGAFAYDISKGIYVGKQTGSLRISAFNSIERPNLVEKCVSKEVIDLTTSELGGFEMTTDFVNKHEKLWSDNNFWLTRIYDKNFKHQNRYKKAYSILLSPASKVNLYDPWYAYISRCMKKMKKDFTYEKEITIFAGTFNVNGKIYNEDIDSWLFSKGSLLEDTADVYVIGLEEVVELTPGHMLSTDPYVKQFWEKKILKHLNNAGKKKYINAWGGQLGGILLLLFINDAEYLKVKHIEGDVKKTGFGGMSANKGAVAVRFTYSTTKFCLLVSHLAAGLENVEQRHNDYKTIVKNIRFARDVMIKDHDAVIWMGDFNYRILLSNEEVRKAIWAKEYAKLFERDQLNQQMIAGESFPYYNEMEIDFPPTYKFDPGTSTYDTSEKMRIPAWTDRILSRGEILKQLSYGCAEDITFSDHRPVYATFRALVTVVDEAQKAKLATDIYNRITSELSNLTDEEKYVLLNEGTLVIDSQESHQAVPTQLGVKRGKKLSPPSSDTKKWWIGNGKQVKVTLDVDPAQYMLNPHKNVNPFFHDNAEPFFVSRSG